MKVIIAIEEVNFGHQAADYVVAHNWPDKTEFKLVHAIEPSELVDLVTTIYGETETTGILAEQIRSGGLLLDEIQAQLERGLPGNSLIGRAIVVGKGSDVVLHEAQTWHADLIIMGSHGYGAVSRLLLGSTSIAVLERAQCSVLMLKPPKGFEEQNSGLRSIHLSNEDLPQQMVSLAAEK